jgi:hypothetical protein
VRSSALLQQQGGEEEPAPKAGAGATLQLVREPSGALGEGPAPSENGDGASQDGASSFGGCPAGSPLLAARC